MGESTDIWQGTLALMVLKTLEAMGPQHGYGIARRIEQTSDDLLTINYGTLYPALLKLEQEGASRRSGASPTTTAGPSSTASRARGGTMRRGPRVGADDATLARFFEPAEES